MKDTPKAPAKDDAGAVGFWSACESLPDDIVGCAQGRKKPSVKVIVKNHKGHRPSPT